jgi:glycosyltransferase involved in cell wall biosynthesis
VRFLILTQYYAPEIGAPQTRLWSMSNELKRLGHELEVVTSLPNYPRGKIFSGYQRTFYRREILDGITVHRVWLYPALGSGFRRMLNYGSFTVTSLFGLFFVKKPDYIFVEAPPLFLSLPAYIAGLWYRAPFILNVADLWPDAAVEGGILKDGILLRMLYAIERWSYRKAAYINAVTEGIRESLLRKKDVPSRKVLFLPNGVDTDRFQPSPADLDLKKKLGLEGKKIILWAGTLGFAHGLDYVLQAAGLLRGNPEIHFLFLGDGSARSTLQQLSKKLELRNVSFHDPVPSAHLPPFFSIAEAGLASLLGTAIHDGARPSKIFPVLASGKPVIFVGRGEAARLVQDANAGIVVPPEDPEALANAILQFIEKPEWIEELGKNGRSFVKLNFEWSKLTREWVAQLNNQSERERLATVETRI